ncbi:MAG: hypothetical protein OXH93_12985 [Caldilineaceae bacterium]|nr:hypothetical protein [Caldilineaceae bacterium]MDE0463323.1 hypothetical protein [Caldilineaceae bacterium]
MKEPNNERTRCKLTLYDSLTYTAALLFSVFLCYMFSEGFLGYFVFLCYMFFKGLFG